jgi:hypothetical protein
MSDPARTPPRHVADAAKIVDGWLRSVEQPPAQRRDRDRDWAAALDRCRQHDQSKMPAWQDPRKPR